jgi:hypothetical protein
MTGWLVSISDWDRKGPAQLFSVAEEDPRKALIVVQALTNAAPGLRVETVGQLSQEIIQVLGLTKGQAKALSPTGGG